MRNFQAAIDMEFPRAGGNQANEVFSDVVRQAGAQALMFLDSIEPLCDILLTTGMSQAEAWKRVALYPKSLFDTVRMVRVTVPKGMKGGAMLWGSFQTTKLVAEFAKYHFTDHPRIASMLAITSMQKEGQILKKLVNDFNRLTGKVAEQDKRLVEAEKKKGKPRDVGPQAGELLTPGAYRRTGNRISGAGVLPWGNCPGRHSARGTIGKTYGGCVGQTG